jgi:hypothetical protein
MESHFTSLRSAAGYGWALETLVALLFRPALVLHFSTIPRMHITLWIALDRLDP